LGSNFSTNFKKETFEDFGRYPGSVFQVIKKKIFVIAKRKLKVVIHSFEVISKED
jgi:hypothetical protein